ncbi:UNVERIFIED_CONTAM: hypothetical protein Cloal_2542 [Acetivibrio alkalicellulosi]
MFGRIGEAGYVLSTRELIFLAGLTGAKELHGIEDNTYELEKEELKNEWKKVKINLLNKRYIQCDKDKITVDRELFLLIDACCNPKVYIKYTNLDMGNLKHLRNMYITEKIAVEIDKSRQSHNNWILTPLVNIGKVANNLSECFITKKEYESVDNYFEVSIRDFFQLDQTIKKNNKEDVYKLLSQFGMSNDIAKDYIKAYEKNSVKTLMTMITDSEGKKDMQTLWLLEGKNYMWKTEALNFDLLIKNEENKIKIGTVNCQQIVSEIEDMVCNYSNIFLSAMCQE